MRPKEIIPLKEISNINTIERNWYMKNEFCYVEVKLF